MIEAIQVWRFEVAPQELRDLSHHGGDEDWVALIPPSHTAEYIGCAEPGGAFGCCDVSEHNHPTKPGYKVRIGAHS